MIATIEKRGLRKKILDACIAKQEYLINDFRDRIKELTSSDGLGNEEPYDNSTVAANSANVLEINTLNNQLTLANSELQILEQLRTSKEFARDHVSLGAIVVTNRATFFISASLEQINVGGVVYVGISTASPIYLVMEGKSKGDRFVFKGKRYEIKDVF